MYIIVSEDHVWIWVGRLVPKTARREAMNNAVVSKISFYIPT